MEGRIREGASTWWNEKIWVAAVAMQRPEEPGGGRCRSWRHESSQSANDERRGGRRGGELRSVGGSRYNQKRQQ